MWQVLGFNYCHNCTNVVNKEDKWLEAKNNTNFNTKTEKYNIRVTLNKADKLALEKKQHNIIKKNYTRKQSRDIEILAIN